MPKPGDYVQIWDKYQGHEHPNYIKGHGRLGYVIKKLSDTVDADDNGQGPIFEVICFGSDQAERYNVWYGWLNKIMKVGDIQKYAE